MYNSRSTLDRAFDALIGYEIRELNSHLPKRRPPMSELLKKNTDATIEAVDGSTIVLKASELQELATVGPPEYRDRIQLPFLILRRTDLGKSAFTVSGERIDEFAVQKILGNTKDGFHELYTLREQTYLCRPELTELLSGSVFQKS